MPLIYSGVAGYTANVSGTANKEGNEASNTLQPPWPESIYCDLIVLLLEFE